MIGSLTINLEQDAKTNIFKDVSLKVELFQGIEENEYSINVQTSLEEDLVSVMRTKDLLDKMLEEYSYIFDDPKLSNYIAKKIETRTLLSNIEEVIIFGDIYDVKEYIAKNPIIQGKRICLGSVLSLNRSNLEKLRKTFGEKSDILVRIEGNSKGISLDVYEKTIIAIEEIVNKIKKYNYSPYEALIHTYDLVRDKFYNMEDENESYAVSRDLSHVLLGDKIVCLGFSNILQTVLKKLGIPSIVFSLSLPDDEPGHARVLSYVEDEKYGIEGLYFCDPTFDCKKNDSNDFLLSYRFFGKPFKEIDRFSGYDFTYVTYDLFAIDEVGELEDSLEEGVLPLEDLIRKVKVARVNRMLRLLEKPTLEIGKKAYTKDEIMDIVCEISDLANRPIDAQTFLKALYRVRRNEYYENPRKFLFDIDVLTKILTNSKLASHQVQGERDLLAALFGRKRVVKCEEADYTVKTYVTENDLDIDINRVKLTRTLRNIRDKKESRNK